MCSCYNHTWHSAMDTSIVLGIWSRNVCYYIGISFYIFINRAFQRNWQLVANLVGVPSVSETILEETHGVDVELGSVNNSEEKSI